MRKLRTDGRGFAIVELCLIIVIIVLVGIIGWLVYKNHHQTTSAITKTSSVSSKTTSSKSSATSSNSTTYSGWQTFSDSVLSIKYPSSWTFSNNTGDVEIDASSQFESFFDMPGYVPQGQVYFSYDIEEDNTQGLANPTDCSQGCDVQAILPLQISGAPTAKLIIFTAYDSSGNQYGYIEVVNGSAAILGSTTSLDEGVTVNGHLLQIVGTVDYDAADQSMDQASFSNLADFEASQEFKDGVNALNSLVVQ